MIILDTDICVELLRGNSKVIANRRATRDAVGVSFITEGELFYGAEKSKSPTRNHHLVEQFLLSVTCIHSDQRIMEQFGSLKAQLAENGEILPDADILIAATALTAGSGQVSTGNKAHFSRFPGLYILDWTQ